MHQCNQDLKGEEFLATNEALLCRSYFIISQNLIASYQQKKILLGEGSSHLKLEVTTFDWSEDG